MKGEQEKTLEALQTAIEMEIDGRECYLAASRQSGNEVGRKLLASLAEEEDQHRRRFQEIYEALRQKKAWPEAALPGEQAERLRSQFVGSCELAGAGVSGGRAEFEEIDRAVENEKKSADFYQSRSRAAAYDAEREFYRALAAEERAHELVLLDYYEYLTDPVGWFTRQEHHSLDGG